MNGGERLLTWTPFLTLQLRGDDFGSVYFGSVYRTPQALQGKGSFSVHCPGNIPQQKFSVHVDLLTPLLSTEEKLLPVRPQLCARVAAHSLGVQLGKRTLPTAPNEGVPIVVLGLPSWVILVLWLRTWYNTMLCSTETAIEKDHPPFLRSQSQGCCRLGGPQRQAQGENQNGLFDHYHFGGPCLLGTENNKCTICEREPKSENIVKKGIGEKVVYGGIWYVKRRVCMHHYSACILG